MLNIYLEFYHFKINYIDDVILEKKLDALHLFFQKKIVAIIFCKIFLSGLPIKGLLKLNDKTYFW